MKKSLTLISTLAAASALAGCNTVAGIGEDITSASETIQREISEDRSEPAPQPQPSDNDDELLGGPGGG